MKSLYWPTTRSQSISTSKPSIYAIIGQEAIMARYATFPRIYIRSHHRRRTYIWDMTWRFLRRAGCITMGPWGMMEKISLRAGECFRVNIWGIAPMERSWSGLSPISVKLTFWVCIRADGNLSDVSRVYRQFLVYMKSKVSKINPPWSSSTPHFKTAHKSPTSKSQVPQLSNSSSLSQIVSSSPSRSLMKVRV